MGHDALLGGFIDQKGPIDRDIQPLRAVRPDGQDGNPAASTLGDKARSGTCQLGKFNASFNRERPCRWKRIGQALEIGGIAVLLDKLGPATVQCDLDLAGAPFGCIKGISEEIVPEQPGGRENLDIVEMGMAGVAVGPLGKFNRTGVKDAFIDLQVRNKSIS